VLVALPEHIRISGQLIEVQKFTPNPDPRVLEQKYVTQRADAYKMICSAQERLKAYRCMTDTEYQPISAKFRGQKNYINPLGEKLSKMTTVIENASHYEVIQKLTRKDTYNLVSNGTNDLDSKIHLDTKGLCMNSLLKLMQTKFGVPPTKTHRKIFSEPPFADFPPENFAQNLPPHLTPGKNPQILPANS
jgi:hypothetical protein